VGVLFARFLAGRRDVLPFDYVESLANYDLKTPPPGRVEVEQLLAAELGETGRRLARESAAEPCWSTPVRCAWQSFFQDAPVIVQVARPVPSEDAIAAFVAGLRACGHPVAPIVTSLPVVLQFREWLGYTEAPSRERRLLDTLLEMQGKTETLFPAIIPELSTDRVLAWPWVSGESLGPVAARAVPGIRRMMAEAILEQACVLSFVEGEMDFSALVLTSGQRLAWRRVARPVPITMGRERTLLRYIASTLNENSADAAHWLLALAGHREAHRLKSRLRAAMSAIQPELSAREGQSAAVAAFEGNWRALAALGVDRPLFIDYLHRNLVTVAAAPAHPDCLGEAQASVLGTMLRNRVGRTLRRDALGEWIVASGLAALESLRYINRVASELQEGPASIPVPRRRKESQSRLNRVAMFGTFTAIFLASFLVCLRWSSRLHQPWSTTLAVAALLSALGLFWSLSRME
jgi:hypothetical protein